MEDILKLIERARTFTVPSPHEFHDCHNSMRDRLVCCALFDVHNLDSFAVNKRLQTSIYFSVFGSLRFP